MEHIFLTILNMSGTAAVVILVVLLARLALRKAPKVFSYALWAVVLFRLLCPFTIPSAFSLLPSARVMDVPGRGESTAQVIQVDTGISAINQPVNDFFLRHPYQGQAALPEDAEAVPAPPISQLGPEPDWRAVPAAIWLTVAALLLGYSVFSTLRLRRKLTESIPLAGEKNVRIADHIPSPFVLGLFRPKIYLPSGLPEGERDYILLHERTHIRRGDHILRALAWLALALHWFNPLVWLAFHLAGRDMEMSCDEAVLRNMDRDVRADYSSSLLRLSTGKHLPAGPLAFGDGDPQRRIKNILSYKKPALWVIAAALIVVVGVGAALATNPGAMLDSPDPGGGLTCAFNEDHTAVVVTGHEAERAEWYFADGPSPDSLFPLGYAYISGVVVPSGWEGHGYAFWTSGDRNAVKLELISAARAVVMDFTVTNAPSSEPVIIERKVNGDASEDFPLSDDVVLELAERFARYLRVAEEFYENARMDQFISGPAEVWLDYAHAPQNMPWDDSFELGLEEYPGVTFRWTATTLTAVTEDGEETLFTGMPIWSVYLCDLTGDGRRELCAQVSYGSGMIDEHIAVYDYAGQTLHTLWDRGVHDYYLWLVGDQLAASERDYMGETDLRAGPLVLTSSGLDISGSRPSPDVSAPPALASEPPDLAADLTLSVSDSDSIGPVVRIDGTVGGMVLTRGAFWYPEQTAWGENPLGELSMIYPAFTDGIEGHVTAWWTDASRTSVTLSTHMTAMLSSLFNVGWWEFTVNLNDGAVAEMAAQSLRKGLPDFDTHMYPESITDEEAVNAARIAAKLMTAAEDFWELSAVPAG